MTNEQIMKVLLSYENLKELSYENNILKFKDKSVSLENINLYEFFANKYSQLYIDQTTISAEDFFNIMFLHSMSLEPTEQQIHEERNINNLEFYALNQLDNVGDQS